ncbi:MAG TPA: FAD-dependent oxidoreductase [Acetobacteraceae bacterium]|jgi:2-polyprenyl-6-methoxyphenol hydroxylase-like FAD-dependent oxidoreductase|nr:FAD-dependent oxidoreductase [Acetobacteraceae bacterium]
MPAPIITRCCIAGGGPAGVMAGFLLARAGVDVVVLEKHADFFRDFRGDTIHPSTLEVMHELGLLDEFLTLPHSKVVHLGAQVGDTFVPIADLSHLPTHCKFVALMPQWDFLDFLARQGRRFPGFHMMMGAEATGLLRIGDTVTGVTATTADAAPGATIEIRAELVIAADGRASTLRPLVGFQPIEFGAPMDILWMRLSRRAGDPTDSLGRLDAGRMIVLINRNEYWQCAYVIPKGGIDRVRAAGLEAFRQDIVRLLPVFADRVAELKTWDDIKLLTVAVDRLETWHKPGFLCIGDAAHAMSPIGGVGVNLAVQDAVATANILAPRFRTGGVTEADLAAVQRRREWPTRMTQRLQLIAQNRVISGVLRGTTPPRPPLMLRWFGRLPFLQRIPARVIGMGFRPEHIRTPPAPLPSPH